MSANTNLV